MKDKFEFLEEHFGHHHGKHRHGGPTAYIGKPAPEFEMEAVMPDGEGMGRFGKVSLKENMEKGKWTVLYFYPRDFTFVCPTEIRKFNSLYPKFKELNAEVIACSSDSPYVHLKWQETDLGLLQHPHASDTNLRVGRAYGVLDAEAGLTLRGTFIIDPQGILQAYSINTAGIGRNVEEFVRLLEAAQAAAEGKLLPCEWKPGEATL